MDRKLKIILSASALFAAIVQSPAQIPESYRPLSEFGTDTTAYLNYNWGDPNCSSYRTLGQFLECFELPIRSVYIMVYPQTGKLAVVSFYLRNLEDILPLEREAQDKYELFGPVLYGEEPYYEDLFGKPAEDEEIYLEWDESMRELLKDVPIYCLTFSGWAHSK